MSEPTFSDLLQAVHELGQRMERGFAELGQRMEHGLAEVKADVAEVRGRMSDAPTARDFGRLEGRLDEISRRLPVPLAYQPPEGGRKRA